MGRVEAKLAPETPHPEAAPPRKHDPSSMVGDSPASNPIYRVLGQSSSWSAASSMLFPESGGDCSSDNGDCLDSHNDSDGNGDSGLVKKRRSAGGHTSSGGRSLSAGRCNVRVHRACATDHNSSDALVAGSATSGGLPSKCSTRSERR